MKNKKFIIYGPNKLNGDIKISGSKNSALPILFSCLLNNEEVKINNIPLLKDIYITIKIFKKIGVKIIQEKNSIIINAKYINNNNLTFNLIKKIRASIWLLSPILIRFKKIKLNIPGGCKIGHRPIDMHIYALKCLGIKINIKKNIILGKVKNKIKNNIITFKKISVGATITAILGSILIPGITIIKNYAKEPEVIDTINFLIKIGSKINIKNNNILLIKGVKKLFSTNYTIISDRIETGTYLIGAILCKSKITCYNINPNILYNILKKIILTGAKLIIKKDFITINVKNIKIKPVNIITNPYPGFPTDLQPQFTLLNALSLGKSYIIENVFKKRLDHIYQLNKMGTKIYNKKNIIICEGVKKIKSNIIRSTDLRNAATLLLAGCIAYGKTEIKSIYYIYRGYENIIEKFKNLGVNIIIN